MSSIMLYGPPGGGKTTLAASLYKLGFIPTFIDLDRKVRTMENLQEPLASGKIRVIDFKSRLVEESFKNRIKKGIGGPTGKMLKEPQGYMEIADIVTQLEEQPVEDHDKVVPILDSFTRADEHLKRYIMWANQRNVITQPDWGFIRTNFEELFDSWFRMQPLTYPHCVIIAHDRPERDELDGRVKIRPQISSGFRDVAGSYVDEQYYCFVEVSRSGEAEYKVMTKPVGQVDQARTSRVLNTWVPADFELIFNAPKAEKKKPIQGPKLKK